MPTSTEVKTKDPHDPDRGFDSNCGTDLVGNRVGEGLNTYPTKAPLYRPVHGVQVSAMRHEVALYRRGDDGKYEVLVGKGAKGLLSFPTSTLQTEERMHQLVARVARVATGQSLTGLVQQPWPTETFEMAADGKEAVGVSMVDANALTTPITGVASDKEAKQLGLRQVQWRTVPTLLSVAVTLAMYASTSLLHSVQKQHAL